MLPLIVAILNLGTAFPGFLGRNPADVLTLSAYRIILPVLWRDPRLTAHDWNFATRQLP